jgi:hypothetical protein
MIRARRRGWLVATAVALSVVSPGFVAPSLAAASTPGTCNQQTIDHREFSTFTVTFYCEADYIHVDGMTSLPSGAILELNGSTAVGPIALDSGSDVTVNSSTTGPVETSGGVVDVSLSRASVHGSVTGSFDPGSARDLKVADSNVHGRVQWYSQTPALGARHQSAEITNDTIGGNLELHQLATTVTQTTVGGDLMLFNGPHFTQLCSVHVDGNATIGYNPTAVYVGANQNSQPCPAGVTVAGSLTVTGNQGGVLLQNMVIDGNLSCIGNSEVRLVNTVVHGTRSGQCALRSAHPEG